MPVAQANQLPRLRVRQISKAFPGVQALDDVTLAVEPGEIHALVGENGAGKSTLMNIIAGVYAPDAGALELDGHSVHIPDEHAASVLGIAMVHQEPSLAPLLSIAENVFAGHPLTDRLGLLDWRTMITRAAEILARLGVQLDPRRRVASLSPAQRQMIEIAKALSRSVRLLILDEPTAALTLFASATRSVLERQADLFEVVRQAAPSEPDIAELEQRASLSRWHDLQQLAQALADRGALRSDLDVDAAADIIWALASPQLYRPLVAGRRWSGERWETWLDGILRSQLLAPRRTGGLSGNRRTLPGR